MQSREAMGDVGAPPKCDVGLGDKRLRKVLLAGFLAGGRMDVCGADATAGIWDGWTVTSDGRAGCSLR
ncbi:unnamed protein product [Lampetra planeri]